MKRIISILILAVLLIGTLTSCGVEAPPKIKEGRFNFSITYEHSGEQKTIDGVFVCEFSGYDFTLEGGNFTRCWDGYIEGVENLHDTYYATTCLQKTKDGGEILLNFGVFASHFMGEPDFADSVIEPSIFIEYSNEDNTTSESGGGSEEAENLYGYKIVDYHYDAPVENTFGFFG